MAKKKGKTGDRLSWEQKGKKTSLPAKGGHSIRKKEQTVGWGKRKLHPAKERGEKEGKCTCYTAWGRSVEKKKRGLNLRGKKGEHNRRDVQKRGGKPAVRQTCMGKKDTHILPLERGNKVGENVPIENRQGGKRNQALKEAGNRKKKKK